MSRHLKARSALRFGNCLDSSHFGSYADLDMQLLRGTRRLQYLKADHPKEYRRLICRAIAKASGRVPLAARALGISRTTLFAWLRRDRELLGGVTRAPNGRPARASIPKEEESS